MNAVCTILGWWTAAAAAAGGAGIVIALEFPVWSIGDEFLGVVPFTSASGLLLAVMVALVFVGVVISIGSPGDGADIWMVGVVIGTIRMPIDSDGPSMARRDRWGLAVAVAICATILTGTVLVCEQEQEGVAGMDERAEPRESSASSGTGVG
jgi:low affinity Fe/Cu permease